MEERREAEAPVLNLQQHGDCTTCRWWILDEESPPIYNWCIKLRKAIYSPIEACPYYTPKRESESREEKQT